MRAPGPSASLVLVCATAWLGVAAPASAARPKLGVLIVFDQLRSVELDRYAPFFGATGFGGLDGARFDALYGFAATETGPGHATLATGASPSVHGIAINSWYAREGDTYVRRYAVDDPTVKVLGAADGVSGRSAHAMLAPTLGDTMKIESHDRARVVTVSLKDRAAVLSGGHGADLAIWYEPSLGRFTTSTAYVAALPAWLEDIGTALPARAIAGAPWTPLAVPPALASLVPVDDRPGEGSHEGLTRTFPHDWRAHPDALRKKLYRMHPQAMDDVVDIALRAVTELALGSDDEPDLLVVSISTTDYVGHNFGPDSMEQLDTLRRADALVRRLVAALEKRVGRRDLVVAISSDHGASPPPLAKTGSRAKNGVLSIADVNTAAEAGARAALPKDTKKRVLGIFMPEIFLDTAGLSAADERRLLDAVRAGVARVPGVAHVYDMTAKNSDDDYSTFMNETAVPGRHGQLFVRQEPRFIALDTAQQPGTDHGSPYVYDRRVPLLVSGPGVKRGRWATPVDPRDVAPTLAFLLGVPPPDAAQGVPVPACNP